MQYAGEQTKEYKARSSEYQADMYGRTEFDRYAQAVGAEVYRITVTKFTPEKTQAFVFKGKGKNGEVLPEWKTPDDIRDKFWPLLQTYPRRQQNVCITPKSKGKYHIVVDDLTADNLKQLKADGYRPACVVESSPGNFQAILNVPSLKGDTSTETGDRAIANRLAKILNEKYGDPRFSGSLHGHRLPPFGNFKPKHRRPDGSYPETHLIESNGGICLKAFEQLKEITAEQERQRIEMEQRAEQERVEREERKRQQKAASGSKALVGEGSCDPDGAYWAHYAKVIEYKRDNLSTVDAAIGIRMRITGYSESQVQSAIENNTPMMHQQNVTHDFYRAKYGSKNWRDYARRTARDYVFGSSGSALCEQMENRNRNCRANFLWDEGRTEDWKIEKRKQEELEGNYKQTAHKTQNLKISRSNNFTGKQDSGLGR